MRKKRNSQDKNLVLSECRANHSARSNARGVARFRISANDMIALRCKGGRSFAGLRRGCGRSARIALGNAAAIGLSSGLIRR